jgi:hypothetical protein
VLTRRDEGSLSLLIIGFVAIAAALIVICVDVSKVFLARRALASAADAAALAAAAAVDRNAVYDHGISCGELLPLDPQRAQELATNAVLDDASDLDRVVSHLQAPTAEVDGGTVTVRLSADVSVPFGRVVTMLTGAGGPINVAVAAHAQSPLSQPGGCSPA